MLLLRRDTTPGVKVSINPGPERSADERERISRFRFEIDIANPNLGNAVEKAKEAMGLSDTTNDILKTIWPTSSVCRQAPLLASQILTVDPQRSMGKNADPV
jgi:hypothetical protein